MLDAQEWRYWNALNQDTRASSQIRQFDTGATRDSDADKPDPEGFLSPLVIQRYSKYMHENRKMRDGSKRSSDNWQKGIPREAYIKSAWRHFLDWWLFHRGHCGRETLEEALCGLLFNTMGYLHEVLKRRFSECAPATATAAPIVEPNSQTTRL